jgi:site-specific DNA recombinase
MTMLTDLRLNGELTKEEFQSKKQKLKDRQYEINALLLNYDKADDKFTETTEMLINIASEALETFKSSEMDKKRQILNFIFANLELKGCKMHYSLRFPFDKLQEVANCPEWRGVVDNFRTELTTKMLIVQMSDTLTSQLY